MRVFEITEPGGTAPVPGERPDPVAGPGQVVVAMRAASLNYRDTSIVAGRAARPGQGLPLVPLSDGAGEVVEVGPGVQGLAVGDRVASLFFPRWMSGPPAPDKLEPALGGSCDGVLSERWATGADEVIAIPGHLSYEEAATLPCAALTAWNSLVVLGRLKAGDTVLVLGTGGVSIFALQLARLHGATVIATSSSDEKLARAVELGATHTINYVEHPEWHREVLALTDGRGVDHVVEVGGAGTLERSMKATRVGGTIGLIGVLTGRGAGLDPSLMLLKNLHVHGVYVGSKEMFADMNAAIAVGALHPVVDQVFGFDDTPAAYGHLMSATHLGKVVISI